MKIRCTWSGKPPPSPASTHFLHHFLPNECTLLSWSLEQAVYFAGESLTFWSKSMHLMAERNVILRAMWLNGGSSDLLLTPQASINPLQGFLNCLVYGQHRPFTACCTHIFGGSHQENYPHCPPDDFEERNKALTINSLSGSVKIPVSEISRLLTGGSERGTPPLRTPPIQSPGKPFTARLLGESRYSS